MANFLKRYCSGFGSRIFWLRILSFLSLVAITISVLLIYRHQTEDALIPVSSYLMSFRLVIPPAIALLAIYTYAIVSGISLQGAPVRLRSWMQNRLFQSAWMMLVLVLCSVLLAAATCYMERYMTAPAYDKFVAQVISGNSGDQRIPDTLKFIEDRNPKLAEHMELILQLFIEQKSWRNEGKSSGTTLPRIFIRGLDGNYVQTTETESCWESDPLRWFAAAEAYSMFIQAAAEQKLVDASKLTMKFYRERAVGLFRLVAASKDARVTPLMRTRATENVANVFYYAGDYKQAIKEYENAARSLEHLTPATEANRVSALVRSGKLDEAIALGAAALHWTQETGNVLNEIHGYIALEANTAIGEMKSGKKELADSACSRMKEVSELLPNVIEGKNHYFFCAGQVDGGATY